MIAIVIIDRRRLEKMKYDNPACDDMLICENLSYSELPFSCRIKIGKGICKKA